LYEITIEAPFGLQYLRLLSPVLEEVHHFRPQAKKAQSHERLRLYVFHDAEVGI